MTTLYLRSMPESLVREAKAAAARRGMTLTSLVTEALGQALGTGDSNDGRFPVELEADRIWFEERRPRLLRRYRGQYVAIVDRRVVGHDRVFARLAARVFRRFGPRPVFMPKCLEEERVVSVPSPRVVRS